MAKLTRIITIEGSPSWLRSTIEGSVPAGTNELPGGQTITVEVTEDSNNLASKLGAKSHFFNTRRNSNAKHKKSL